MTVPPADAGGAHEQRALLFTPGARLGWIFRDRRELAAPYSESPPDEATLRERVAARVQEAEANYQRMRKWVGVPSLAVLVLLLLLAGCEKQINGQASTGGTLLTALVLGIPGIIITSVYWQKREQAKQLKPGEDYEQAQQVWEQGADAHEQTELARLHDAVEWGSAEPPTQRVDVFGGSLWGWQALLTTHGASILAAQPLLAVDLTGELACAELIELAEANGVPTAVYTLPADIGRCGLLTSLSAGQLADALAEAIHAGQTDGSRTDRAVDIRVLEQLAGALGDDVSPVRLAAAAQAALGHAVPAGLLTPQEQTHIGGELFPAGYRKEIGPNLVRLDAFLTDLARYTSADGAPDGQPATAPGYLTCLALEPGPRGARIEMLAALIVQWLTVQVTGSHASAPAVIIAGADEIARAHTERLASACERRGVPLTLMFRHLRDDGLGLLGGGTAVFMRLGHHAEAEQAASFIGRQHKFALSQLTAKLGGNETHTRTETEEYGVSHTSARVARKGWQETLGRHSMNFGRPHSRTHSRNWSTALSWAHGTNWSNAKATQRVYEYTVEPTVLQSLPDHAMLLVNRGTPGPDLHSVECDPAIITLPRVSTKPLAPVPRPDQIANPAKPASGAWTGWAGQQETLDRQPLPTQPAQPDPSAIPGQRATSGQRPTSGQQAGPGQPAYLPTPELPPPSRDQWSRPDPS
jgi:hypothetical protein